MLFFDDDLDSEKNSEVNIDKNKSKIAKKNERAEKRDINNKESKILIRRTEEKKNKKKQKFILTAIFLISLILFFFIFFYFGFFDKFRASIDLNEEALHVSETKGETVIEKDGLTHKSIFLKETSDSPKGNEEGSKELNSKTYESKDRINLELSKDDSAEEENDREVKKDDNSQANPNQDNINNENNNSGLLYSISEISDPFFAGESETKELEAKNETEEVSAEQTLGFQSAANMLDNADEEVNGSLIEREEDIIQAPVSQVDQVSSSDIESTVFPETLEHNNDSKDNFDEQINITDNEVLIKNAVAQDKENNKNIKVEENVNQADNGAGVESKAEAKSKDSAKSSQLNDTEDKNKEVEKVELKIPFALRGTIVNDDQAEALFFYNNSLIRRKVGEKIENFKVLGITKKEVLISFMDYEHKMHIWGHDKVEAAE